LTKPIIGVPMRNNYAGNDGILYWNRSYATAISEAGGVPLPIPLSGNRNDLAQVYEMIDGLLLSGGGDVSARFYDGKDSDLITYIDEERDENELLLARWAMGDELPILAICRGIQLLNVAAGGTLHADVPTSFPDSPLRHATPRDIPRDHRAHSVRVTSGTLLSTALGCNQVDNGSAGNELVEVNSMHHQALDTVGDPFRVVAWATDGVIEAIEPAEMNGHYWLGVQWHPEEMIHSSDYMRRLFDSFVQRCTN